MWPFSLPEGASTIAGPVDLIFIVMTLLSTVFVVGISGLIIYFAVKYRRGTSANRENRPDTNYLLEFSWIGALLVLGLAVFAWAAAIYLDVYDPPRETLEIVVIGKQWMWKAQHPDGQSEINQLHVPVGQPIKLLMTSQDVIHSFWVPAFRVKRDVVPGMYTTMWFEATQTGTFPLRCSEYCGAHHSLMIGDVIVMEPTEYQAWLAGGTETLSLVDAGEQLFVRLGCESCHKPDDSGLGPSLVGVFGETVTLESGATVIADESYIRESILFPDEQIVSGYRPIMPSFQGQVDEEELVRLVAYIRSLGNEMEEGNESEPRRESEPIDQQP